MSSPKEKYLFAFLGALTAIVFALGFYSDFTVVSSDRVPASGNTPAEQNIPYFVD